MLSNAVKAYLILQVFDYVHRSLEPVRFNRLKDELEDLVAWPEFQEVAINDPRFLVVGDCIDIATAGIHISCAVEEIVLQTVNLLRVPMTDYTLIRLVRRMRPDLPANVDPIARAIAKGVIFRPRVGHIALLSWLSEAKTLPLSITWPKTFEEAGNEALKQVGKPLEVTDLATTIAEVYGIPIKQAYTSLANNPTLLLLPDGTVYLYDVIADDLTNWLSRGYDDIETQVSVPLPGEIEAVPIPTDLAKQLIQRCIFTGKPISTAEIIKDILRLEPGSHRYISSFRAVTRWLGLTPEILPVGHHLWMATALIPVEVFRKITGGSSETSQAIEPRLEKNRLSNRHFNMEPKGSDSFSILITENFLQAGCLKDYRIGSFFPDHPLIQVIQWEGGQENVWYNADYRTIFGLRPWFYKKNICPGDRVMLSFQSGRLKGLVVRNSDTSLSEQFKRTLRRGKPEKSLLVAVAEHLARAGGSLTKEELMTLLTEEDSEITWSEVEPLFERFPLLKFRGGRCFITPRSKIKNQSLPKDPLIQAEVLKTISGLPDQVRNDPRVLQLVWFVAELPRVKVREEALMLVAAQQGRNVERELLCTSHLRFALRQLLHRQDIYDLLPDIEDYFQESVIGLIAALDKFEIRQSIRLQHAMSWRVKSAIDRAVPWYISPVRFPDHVFWRIMKLKKDTNVDSQKMVFTEGEDEEVVSEDLLRQWAEAEWLDWETLMQEGIGGDEDWLIAEEDDYDMESSIVDKVFVDTLLKTLDQRTAEVISRHCGIRTGREQTFDEISVDYGVSRARIQQIYSKGIGTLQKTVSKWG